VGRAIAKVLEEEIGIPWRVQPVPKEERHPDVRITPSAPTPIAAHEVEVRHLDEEAIKAVNSNRPLDRRENVQTLAAMFKDAVMKKHDHYDRAWIPRGNSRSRSRCPSVQRSCRCCVTRRQPLATAFARGPHRGYWSPTMQPPDEVAPSGGKVRRPARRCGPNIL